MKSCSFKIFKCTALEILKLKWISDADSYFFSSLNLYLIACGYENSNSSILIIDLC